MAKEKLAINVLNDCVKLIKKSRKDNILIYNYYMEFTLTETINYMNKQIEKIKKLKDDN